MLDSKIVFIFSWAPYTSFSNPILIILISGGYLRFLGPSKFSESPSKFGKAHQNFKFYMYLNGTWTLGPFQEPIVNLVSEYPCFSICLASFKNNNISLTLYLLYVINKNSVGGTRQCHTCRRLLGLRTS